MKHTDFTCIAYQNATSGIAILSVFSYGELYTNGYIKCISFDGEKQSKVTRHKLYKTKSGRYFVKFGKRYYLNKMQFCQ